MPNRASADAVKLGRSGWIAVAGILVALAFGSFEVAAAKTFRPNTGNWEDGNNWDPAGVPGPNDDVRIPPGERVVVTSSSTKNVNSLDVAGGAQIQGGSIDIRATGGVRNYGEIGGKADPGKDAPATSAVRLEAGVGTNTPPGAIENNGQITGGDCCASSTPTTIANNAQIAPNSAGGSVTLVANHIANSSKGEIKGGDCVTAGGTGGMSS